MKGFTIISNLRGAFWLAFIVSSAYGPMPTASACFRCGASDHTLTQRMTATESLNKLMTDVKTNDKIWLFAVDGRKRPYNFLDANGVLVGFDVDIINKVCSIIQKQCKLVLAQFTECTITNRNINYPGRGLMSEWFDGCPGYAMSVDRAGAFDFTDPYLATESSFTVLQGNPSLFDPDSQDYSSFTLTHLNGAVTNALCLARLKKTFGNIIVAANLPEAKELLLNGTADVLFSPRNAIDGLEVLPQRVRCDSGGVGIMLKKGSQLSAWWNPAYETFVLSGGYEELCLQSQVKYNATIDCLPPTYAANLIEMNDLSFDPHSIPQVNDPKVWLFTVSGRRKPFNFLDSEGVLTGFDVDFVNAVCTFANKNCATVLSEFTECSFTDRNINYPGRGLMDGWFDACTGYADSLDRENAFDFTDAYLRSGAFYSVVPGNPSGFKPDLDDFSPFTFIHLTGAYTNGQCLNRLNKTYNKIIIASNLPEAKAKLLSGEADVLFAPRSNIPDLETLPIEVHCERTGSSIMTKKGSALVSWWNEAFRSYVQQGLFRQLCAESVFKYGYPISCLTAFDGQHN
ncbi:unnamed protein product [Lymnaea stagnalis]|uniref:Solute-binding protein family 3/N-terminal domain-containing protein n=1 Tax=Lymnaea stagnalis TaxID=6523 RepID=A0AAV2HI91_LYMST